MSDDIQLGLRIQYDGATAQAGVAQFRKGIDDLSSSLDKSADEAQKLMDKYDPMGAKLRALQADLNALSNAAKNGQIAPGDDAKLDQVYARIQTEINATKSALADFGTASASNFNGMAAAAEKGAFATVGARRELIVLGHEAMTGNFSRMPGSLMVLAERTNLSVSAFGLLGGAIGASAAVVAGVIVAYQQGAAEMAAMNNAIASTNGYAGLTRDGMVALAQSVEQSGDVTIGVAKDLVTTLVSSGRIGAAAIGVVAGLAEDYAKATGKSVEEIGPELVKLFDDPAKGAEELNRSMHFLTAGQLEYIASLQRQGETGRAQLELGNALKDNLEEQSKKLTALGETLTSAKKFWSDMWDAAKGIGAQDAIDKQIQDAKTALRKAQAGVWGGGNVAEKQAAYDALLAQQDAANQEALRRQKIADDNELQVRAASAIAANSKLAQIQALEDQRKLVEKRTIEGKTQDELEAAENRKAEALKEIDKKIRDTRDSMSAEDRATTKAGITADIALAKESASLEIEVIRSKVADRELTEEQGILKIRDIKDAALQTEYAAEKAMLGTTRSNAAERIAIEAQMRATLFAMAQNGMQAGKELTANAVKVAQEAAKQFEAYAKQELKAQQLVTDFIRKTSREDDRIARQAEMITMRERDIEVMKVQMKLEEDAAQERTRIEHEIPDEKLRAAAIDDVNRALEVQKATLTATALRVYDYAAAWSTGAKQAVNSYLDAADNMAEQTKHLTTDVFQGVEDALVNLATKGKADFKSLADSVLADLARIAVKKGEAWVINWAIDAFTGTGSGNGGSGGSGGTGNSTLGTAGSLVSLYQGGSQLYSGLTTGSGTGLWGQAGNYIGNLFGTASAPAGAGVTASPVIDTTSMSGVTTTTYDAAGNVVGTSVGSGAGSGSGMFSDMAGSDYAGSATGSSAGAWGAGIAGAILAGLLYNDAHTGGPMVGGNAFSAMGANGAQASSTFAGSGTLFDNNLGNATARTVYNGQTVYAGDQQGLLDANGLPLSLAATLPSRNDALSSTLVAFSNSVGSVIKTLGGSASGMQFGLGYSQDPHGTEYDHITGAVTDASGQQTYKHDWSTNRGDVGNGALNTEMQRMLLAAIDSSDAPAIYKHVIGDIGGIKDMDATKLTATITAINNVQAAMSILTGSFKDAANTFTGTQADLIAYATAMHDLQSALTADPFADYAKSVEEANSTILALANSTDALTNAAKSYDGTLAGAQNLAQLATARYQNELALAKQLDTVLQATSQQFGQGRETIATSGLDAGQKYDYYDQQASMDKSLLSVATDPQMIQDYSNKLYTATMNAWGTMDASQQAAHKQEYLDKIDSEQALTTTRINAEKDAVKSDTATLVTTVGDILADAVKKIGDAAAIPQKVNVTATVNLTANGTPVTQVGGWTDNPYSGG